MSSVILGKKPIVIFGASVLGALALRLLETRNLHPECFVDNDTRKQVEEFYGYPVISFQELLSKYPNVAVIIAADRYYEEIYEQVCPYYIEVYRMVHSTPNSKELYLNQLNVVVTERCTLKCKHCSSLIPLYKQPEDCNTEVLLISLWYLLECVDGISRIEVLGGEPFLNKDLPKIIKKLTQSDKILQIDVITNGTVIPKSVKYLKHPKICVVINHYKTSKKVKSLVDKLIMARVHYRQNLHWAWADLGDFHPRNRREEGLKTLFKKCNFSTCTELFNGGLYRCPRSSHGTNLGLIPFNSTDYVDVYTTPSPETLKRKIKHLMNKKFITTCNYCDGNTRQTLILEPAVQ
jgi:hypothetical protein